MEQHLSLQFKNICKLILDSLVVFDSVLHINYDLSVNTAISQEVILMRTACVLLNFQYYLFIFDVFYIQTVTICVLEIAV